MFNPKRKRQIHQKWKLQEQILILNLRLQFRNLKIKEIELRGPEYLHKLILPVSFLEL